jgi:hypothetical protein
MSLSAAQMFLAPLIIVYDHDRLREWWLFDARRHERLAMKTEKCSDGQNSK